VSVGGRAFNRKDRKESRKEREADLVAIAPLSVLGAFLGDLCG